MPPPFVFVSMKSDMMVCTPLDWIGRAVAHPSSGTYRLKPEIIPAAQGSALNGRQIERANNVEVDPIAASLNMRTLTLTLQ